MNFNAIKTSLTFFKSKKELKQSEFFYEIVICGASQCCMSHGMDLVEKK